MGRCEGRVLAIVAEEDEGKVLKVMRRNKLGKTANAIGRVIKGYRGKVYLNTVIGGKRIVDMLSGEQLPRIC